ncbi:MAG: integration host factor subunit beta [Gemmataceae bacterium]|jgi:nucleoid DNA-binding protein|nr:integration host factor subunit beta [Gemmataceae bacterium]
MTKKEIVKKICEIDPELTQQKTKKIVQTVLDMIVETLVQEGRIELRKFGVFEVRRRKARKARNPKTDERVMVPEKNVVTFQPGKEMEARVRLEAKAYEPKKKAQKLDSTTKAGAATSTAKATVGPNKSTPPKPMVPPTNPK